MLPFSNLSDNSNVKIWTFVVISELNGWILEKTPLPLVIPGNAHLLFEKPSGSRHESDVGLFLAATARCALTLRSRFLAEF